MNLRTPLARAFASLVVLSLFASVLPGAQAQGIAHDARFGSAYASVAVGIEDAGSQDPPASTGNSGGSQTGASNNSTPSSPDLVASLMLPAALPRPGDAYPVTVTVRNMGNATAAASDLRFDVDGADPSFTPTPSLATGANFTTTFFWNASSGNHTLRAWADAGDVVSESNESNNIATAHVHVAQQLPNFVAQFVGPSGTALEGQQMWIGGGFRNSGNATATARYEIRVDGGLVASGHVTLAPGQNATVGGQWHATAGNHSASLVVDPYNETQETHELDNARSTSFTVLGIRDLGVEILDVTHRPLRTDAGDVPNPAGARIVRILVTNHADKSATADVSLFASGTGATNTSVSVGSTVATLAPHSSRIVEIAWQPVAAGDVTLLAHVWPRGAYDPDLSDNTDTHEDFVVIGGIGGGAVVR